MALEIERKFLVENAGWRAMVRRASRLRQGYLTASDADDIAEVRVRRTDSGGFLTIKGKGGLVRAEFEYEIPSEDADAILATLCRPLIEKTRFEVELDGIVWFIDEFFGANHGLVLAEVELENEHQLVQLPEWVGAEVTEDARYKNANLAKNPGFWR